MFLRSTLTVLAMVAMLAASSVAQTTSGTVESNETWSGDITLTGDIIISSATVTISPGTNVKMATANDNVVNGTSKRINIIITGTGALIADGTAGAPITFTSTSLFPAKGAWGRIDIMGLSDGNATSFKYCTFAYGQTPVELRNPPSSTAYTVLTLENCTITECGAAGIYFTSGGELNVVDCTFIDCGKGVFVHGGSTTNISGTYFNTMSCAIINAGLTGIEGQTMNLDHCTIYNVDMMLAGTNPKWWDGYGIFNTTNGVAITGEFKLTNSIIYQATLAGMVINGYPITQNNNCWSTGMMGLATIEDGTPGAGSIEQDPLFVDGASDDLRLLVGSPCLNTASDGTNMGAYQGPGIGSGIAGPSAITAEAAGISVNTPVVATARFELADAVTAPVQLRVYSLSGSPVASVDVAAGAQSVEWTPGSTVSAGTYLYHIGNAQGMLIIAE